MNAQLLIVVLLVTMAIHKYTRTYSSWYKKHAVRVLHDKYLAAGKALGAIIFTADTNVRFRCTKNCIGGRGLRIVDKISGKNITIARGQGVLHPLSEEILNKTAFKVHDTKQTILVLDHPTTAMPANLANTSTKYTRNNCKIVHKPGTTYFSIVTTRTLQAGEEVTVPYGTKFTKAIAETVAKAQIFRNINCNTKLPCPICKHMIKKRCLPRHTNSIVCKLYLKNYLTNYSTFYSKLSFLLCTSK